MTDTIAVDMVKPEDVGLSASRLNRIDEYIERLIGAEKVPGAVVLVSRRGRVCHLTSLGVADREAGRPMRPDSIFRLASMTKPITCTAALLLFEEGRFLLDDPISGFIPEFASAIVFGGDAARPITIRHLLTHTSGIGYAFSAVPEVAAMYEQQRIGRLDEPLAEKIPRLAAIPLNHQPGDRWTYGWSHDVIARLVEVVSGETFADFLRGHIFDPLGMVDTGYSHPDRDRTTAVYTPRQGGGLDLVLDEDVSAPHEFTSGGGGLVSTAMDYARFCQMLIGGTLLGRKTVEHMTTNQTGDRRAVGAETPADWSMEAYGMGLGVRVLVDAARSNAGGSLGEYGWSGAASTFFWIDPKEDMFGVFLTQVVPPDFRFGRTVMALALQALVD